jgi:hypothetical protein
MRGVVMKEKITELIGLAKRNSTKPGSFPFLPEIIESLENMQKNLNVSRDRKEKMAGALGRLVTEDFNFSESELGNKLLKIADDFVEYEELL